MTKKILLLISVNTLILVASPYQGYNDDNQPSTIYENGFFHGINCIEREFEMQSRGGSTVSFDGKYLVVIPTDNLPKEQILIYKNYGYLEGMMPVTIQDNYIVFKSFDRKADANYLVENILNAKYFKGEAKAKIIPNTKTIYLKSDFIYGKMFENIRNSIERTIKGQVYVIEEEKPYIEPKINSKTNTKKAKTNTKKAKTNTKKRSDRTQAVPKPKKNIQLQQVMVVSGMAKAQKYNSSFAEDGFLIAGKKYFIDGTLKKDGTLYYKLSHGGLVEADDVVKVH